MASRMPSRELRDLLRWAETQGWTPLGWSSRLHLRVRHVSGAVRSLPPAPAARTLLNLRAQLRRAAQEAPR